MFMYSSSLVFTQSNWSLICSCCNGDQYVASRRVLIRSMAVDTYEMDLNSYLDGRGTFPGGALCPILLYSSPLFSRQL